MTRCCHQVLSQICRTPVTYQCQQQSVEDLCRPCLTIIRILIVMPIVKHWHSLIR